MSNKMKLDNEWKQRQELYAESNQLFAHVPALLAERDALRAQSLAFHYEWCKLHTQRDVMHDEADALFEAAAKEAYGDIKIEWIARDGGLDCVLGHSEVYKWDCEAQEAQEERSG